MEQMLVPPQYWNKMSWKVMDMNDFQYIWLTRPGIPIQTNDGDDSSPVDQSFPN
jgi:hypothetical protein